MFWFVSIGGPAAPDRYPPRSRRHPEDPRAPGPRPLGAESRPRPTHARRRRALIALGRGARTASLPPLTIRPAPPGPSLTGRWPRRGTRLRCRLAAPALPAPAAAVVCAVPAAPAFDNARLRQGAGRVRHAAAAHGRGRPPPEGVHVDYAPRLVVRLLVYDYLDPVKELPSSDEIDHARAGY